MKFLFERIRFCSPCVHTSLMNGSRIPAKFATASYYFSVGKVE